MNYIISQYLVFEKNDQGGILPETRWDRRTRLYNEGHAEAVSNWNKYQEDEKALTNLNKKLQENGQTITDNAERQKIADKVLKNASERARDYGNQIVANTKTLSDFKKENEVENPNKQIKPKFTDGLKGLASSALSTIGNTVLSAVGGMAAEKLFSLAIQGIDALVHWDDNIIAKGQEAKENILSQNEAYKNQKSQLGDLQEQYTKLASGVRITGNAIKNVSLSDDEYQSFLDTSNQIASIAPSMIDNWDSEGNAILKFGTSAKETNQQISDYLQLQRDATHLSIKDNLQDEYKGVVKDAEKVADKVESLDYQKNNADNIASNWTKLKTDIDTNNSVITIPKDKEIRKTLQDKYGILPMPSSDENGESYTVDISSLSSGDKEDLKTYIESKEAVAQSNAKLIESEKLAQEAVQASKWKDLLPSLQAYVESSNMFDKMDSDVAERAKNGINTMLSNIDISKMADQIKDAGDIDDWIDKTLIAPMTSGSKDVQKAWADLFSLEDSYGAEGSKMTVGEWAKKRNEYLETISKGTGESVSSLAKKMGYKTDDGWNIKEQNDVAAARLYGKNYTEDQRKELGNYLNGLTKDNYEIAIDLLINGDKDFSSLDDFKNKLKEAINTAQEDAEKATVSLDAMTTAVASAKTGLSSISTILTETTSSGGVSSDNRTSLMSMFSGVKNGDEEVNLNRLFVTTADGVKLNVDALKDYIHYQQEATDKKFSKGIENQIGDLKDLRTAWQNATGDEKDAALENLKNAQDDYVAYMQQQSEWQAIKKQQNDLLSQYTQWQTAQGTENAGDKYNNIYSGLKNAKDAYDKGLVGTDDFKTFAALISPTGSDDAKNFAENYGKAVRYLTENKTGVNNFLADLKAKGMASYNKSDDRWSFNIDNMDKAAQSLGIGTDFMKANFGRLRDYGIDNNFISSTEEGISRVKELSLALAEEEKRLDSLDDNLATNDTTRSASQKKIAQYKEDLKETTENLSEYYGEDYTQQAAADFDGAAIAVQQLDKSIDKVKKDSTLTAAEKNSMISKMIAEQTELAAEQYSSIEDLRNHDTSSLTEGLETDSNTTVSAIEQINQAYKDQNTEVTDLIDTLSQYSAEQLEGINFNDGKWDTELGDAEKAVESLCDKLGLTKDQTQEVIEALKEAGKLKDSTDSSDESSNTEKIKNEAKEAQEDFNSLTGKSYKIDLDTTDLDTAHKQVEDLSSEVDKYRDRDGTYHPEITGGEELQTMYTGAVSHEQDVEYGSSAMSQADSSSNIVKAAQDFMQAKNEMDVQTQLYQKGMDNTLDQATEDANTAFKTLQQAQTDSGIKLVDTDNIQTAEDQLLQLSNNDIKTKVDVEADTTEAESDMANLQNLQGSTITMNCEVSNEDSLEQAKSTIESMPTGTTATVDIEVSGEEDIEKANELIESAPTNGSELVVNCHVEHAEDLEKLNAAADEANAKGANIKINATVGEVDTSNAESSAKPIELKAKVTPEPEELNVTVKDATVKVTADPDPVEVKTTLDPGEVDKYNPEDKEADVVFHKESSEPDGYQPEDKYPWVHYQLDSSAVDGYQPPDKSATVTYHISTVHDSSSGTHGGTGGGFASGTMLSIAHANGTMHNAPWNYQRISPAFAKGDVAITKPQDALVNEEYINGHSESIVRDGVWSLIPGGAHIENLKKGDIIFSATQTEDLLKHGATHGHARAYAQGTGSTAVITPAFASGSKSSTNTALDNKIKEVSENAKDWVEVALNRLERLFEEYKDIAESDYTTFRASMKYYDKASKTISEEIRKQTDAKAVYEQKANEVATGVGLSEDLKQKVQNGTINVENLSEDDKKRVDAYQKWYEKILDCTKALRDLKKEQKEINKNAFDNIVDRYNAKAETHSSLADYYKAKYENRVSRGYSQYVATGEASYNGTPNSVWYNQHQKQYNALNKEYKTKINELSKLKKARADYLKTDGTSKSDKAYLEMTKTITETRTDILKLNTSMQELKQEMQDAREQHLQWKVDRWERAGSKQDAVIDYAKNNDNPNYQVNEKLLQERVKTNARQVVALQNLRDEKAEYYDTHFKTMNNEEAQEYLESIAQIDEQILKLGSDTESLKNEIMELRWKPFDDEQEKLSSLVAEYQTAQKLLGETDSFYNDDGSFTTNGLTNILLTQESIDATKQKIANYREGLNKLEEQYKNGCYSLDEYNEKSKQLLDGIQQESSALSDLRQNMLDMYETQIKKENDLLQENVDKRKDALSAKEKYYDYDKTLKKKSKDINTLKAQIAALEGTSSAASKARLEKLRAELSDAEDDMADTMHQHEVDMKNTGYENLSESANKALDNTLDAVNKNSAFQEAIIGNMLSNVKTNYDSTYKHLHDVMDQYGLKVSQTYDQMIGKAADFNTAAVNATKAWEGVSKIKVNLPPGTSNGQGGSTTGGGTYNKADDALHKDYDDNKTSNGAGNGTPGTLGDSYTYTLNKSSIYLSPNESYTLKVKWSPKVPTHSDIEWSSDRTNIAKVSSSGKVTAVKGVDSSKNSVLVGGTSKTYKATITAKSPYGTKTCTVYVMPLSFSDAVQEYAGNHGLEVSKDEMQGALQYAYKNGAKEDYQSGKAVEGFVKNKLTKWTDALPARPEGTGDIPDGTSGLASYFMKQGKKVNRNNLQELANILGIETLGASKYESWGSPLKNKILKAYKSYGFSKGGVVRNGIPASILDMIGADALIPRGDSTLIGANPGETVLTEEFTKQLKPTVATLNEFNERMARTQPLTSIPSNNTTNNVSDEYNFTINVASISGDQDIKQLAYKISDIIADRSKRNMRKL